MIYRWGYHFFGLGIDYKIGLHEEIFVLCYRGQGGWTWSEVYELPIHLRRFYIKQVAKAVEEHNKQYEESSKAKSPAMPKFRPK